MGGAGARSPHEQGPPTGLRVRVRRSRTAQCDSLMASPRLARFKGQDSDRRGKERPTPQKEDLKERKKRPPSFSSSQAAPSRLTHLPDPKASCATSSYLSTPSALEDYNSQKPLLSASSNAWQCPALPDPGAFGLPRACVRSPA